MWPFNKRIKQRRLEVRKKVPSEIRSSWQRFRLAGGVGSVLLAGLFWAGAGAMDIVPLDPLPYRRGQYLPRALTARATFRVLDKGKLDKALTDVGPTTPATFRPDIEKIDTLLEPVKHLRTQALADRATTQPDKARREFFQQFGLSGPNPLGKWGKDSGETDKAFTDQIARLRAATIKARIVSPADLRKQRGQRMVNTCKLALPGGTETVDLETLVRPDEPVQLKRAVVGIVAVLDKPLRTPVQVYLLDALTKGEGGQPLLIHDVEATERDIRQAKRELETHPPDRMYDAHLTDDKFISPSRKIDAKGKEVLEPLTEVKLRLLAAEHEAYLHAESLANPGAVYRRAAGRVALLGLLTVAMGWYVWRYQPRIVANHWRGLAVVVVMLLMLLVSKTMVYVMDWHRFSPILTVIMTAVIVGIAYDRRFAISLGTGLAIITVLQLRGDLDMLLVLLTGMTASLLPLQEIRSRSKLIEVAVFAAAAVLLAVVALGISGHVPLRFISVDAAWAVGFTLLVGFLIQGILPVIERAFGIVTSMTLLEWCDASKPLLKRLAMDAPGTYNHSLQLGAMCEAAAEAIGARGLLARVGAYYHDIGKINKPAYFVENAGGDSSSRHEKLSPAMSMLIILGHVKDGVEMAREYGLPAVLHPFISTHHGTTLVQYFYHAAKKHQNGTPDDRGVEEQAFRYPGPKPQIKETGILMLADASESSVRAMTSPAPGQIEDQVHKMVSRRLMDGQLDECEMTLREVHAVEASLIKSLCGVYHSRIAYPAPPGEEPAASEKALAAPAGAQEPPQAPNAAH